MLLDMGTGTDSEHGRSGCPALDMSCIELTCVPRYAQVCRKNPAEKGKYIKIILALLQSTSTAVIYECAVTLVSLSQAPTAIRAAANCYCQLLVSQSDNNVKLIVLDRLQVRECALSLARGARTILDCPCSCFQPHTC